MLIPLNEEQRYIIIDRADIYLSEINGERCPTLVDFYKQIQIALQIPDYFGHNLDALEEVLSDLEWIEQSSILLLIKGIDAFLVNESEETKLELLQLLQKNDHELLEIITLE